MGAPPPKMAETHVSMADAVSFSSLPEAVAHIPRAAAFRYRPTFRGPASGHLAAAWKCL